MLMLSKIGGKKGVSIIVAYVILVTIAIALSVLVYNWLRYYVDVEESEDCPDNIMIVVKDYNYDCDSDKLNITVQNKGLFTVDGFYLRAHNRTGADVGIYVLDKSGEVIKPGEDVAMLNIDSSVDADGNSISGSLTFVEVQPFLQEENKKQIFCGAVASQVLEC